MAVTHIQPTTIHGTPGYSHVAMGAGLAFISGQVPLDPDGRLVGAGDVEAQAAQVFANLAAALAAFGADFTDVLRLNSYITDASFVGGFRTARDRILPSPQPASTLAVVDALASPDWLIEIEAVAVVA